MSPRLHSTIFLFRRPGIVPTLLVLLATGLVCAVPAEENVEQSASTNRGDRCRFALEMADACYEKARRLAGECAELRIELEKQMQRKNVDLPGFPRFCETVCTVARKQVPREKVRAVVAREFDCG